MTYLFIHSLKLSIPTTNSRIFQQWQPNSFNIKHYLNEFIQNDTPFK